MNKLFNIPKMKLLIIVGLVVVLISIITVTVICLNVETPPPEVGEDTDVLLLLEDSTETSIETETEAATEHETETETETIQETETETETEAIPYDESGLLYQSNGNGTCTVVGLGTCLKNDITIPETSPSGLSVVAISTGAFENCNRLERIYIPASIKTIGTGAFVGCTSLTSFSVASTNTEYCSVGSILFSKDKTELICYPARRAGSTYLLNTNVTRIAPYAFDGVSSLTKLIYRGSISQFQSIEVGTGNSNFTKMAIEFNSNALE